MQNLIQKPKVMWIDLDSDNEDVDEEEIEKEEIVTEKV